MDNAVIQEAPATGLQHEESDSKDTQQSVTEMAHPTLDQVREFFNKPVWVPDISAIGPMIDGFADAYPVVVKNGWPEAAQSVAKIWPHLAQAGYNNVLLVSGKHMMLRCTKN